MFCCGGPAAIARAVVIVHIDTVKRGSLWPLPHVSKEVDELSPERADADASPAVIVPPCIVRVGTALAHRAPRTIGWRLNAIGAAMPMNLGRHLLC